WTQIVGPSPEHKFPVSLNAFDKRTADLNNASAAVEISLSRCGTVNLANGRVNSTKFVLKFRRYQIAESRGDVAIHSNLVLVGVTGWTHQLNHRVAQCIAKDLPKM